ncbi:DUF1990 domain-containing protein [Mycolicibacterium sp. Y3]
MTVPAEFSYPGVGLTEPHAVTWSAPTHGYRRFEATVAIGRGDDMWSFAAAEVARWGVKRRSGFRVSPDVPIAQGAEYSIVLAAGAIAIHEPVRVVDVVDTPDRCGFSYGTLLGHPVSGEEAFVVHRDSTGTVFLTLRSLTRPAPRGPWRFAFPALLVAQVFVRRRYLKALAR